MLYGSETRPDKKQHVIRLERNDTRMVRWMRNIIPEDRIFAGELRTRLKLNDTMECLQDQATKFGGNDRAVILPFKYGEQSFVTLFSLFVPYVSLLFLLNISSRVPAKLL